MPGEKITVKDQVRCETCGHDMEGCEDETGKSGRTVCRDCTTEREWRDAGYPCRLCGGQTEPAFRYVGEGMVEGRHCVSSLCPTHGKIQR